MANNLDPLVGKFLARSRRRRQPGLTTTPNTTGTSSSFRPVKQGVARRPSAYDVASQVSAAQRRIEVASQVSDAQRKRKRKGY